MVTAVTHLNLLLSHLERMKCVLFGLTYLVHSYIRDIQPTDKINVAYISSAKKKSNYKCKVRNYVFFTFFHSCTVHLDTIKVFYLPIDAQQSCFKRILKFTLIQLLLVSVQSPSSWSVLFELAKVVVIKIIS